MPAMIMEMRENLKKSRRSHGISMGNLNVFEMFNELVVVCGVKLAAIQHHNIRLLDEYLIGKICEIMLNYIIN